MIKNILLIGNGKLSKSLQKYLGNYNLLIFDENNISSLNKYSGDLLIDCSSPLAFPHIYEYLKKKEIPAIVCSTGHKENDLIQMKKLSKKIPFFKSENFSFGISLINKIIKEYSRQFNLYDTYLLDFHHKNKKDSPSGTSIKISENLNNKVTTLSIRSKDIIGKHTLYFFSNEEEITISHNATSRDVFAKGILKAILFIENKKPGYYTMENIINEI